MVDRPTKPVVRIVVDGRTSDLTRWGDSYVIAGGVTLLAFALSRLAGAGAN